MPTPTNHPPAPVLDSVNVVPRTLEECAQLKAKYAVNTGNHGTNRATFGSHAPAPGQNPPYQSHHVFQNAVVGQGYLVTKHSGWGIMLQGGSGFPSSEHDIANDHQNFRSRQAFKAQHPNPTFGDLKRWSKADLAAALQWGRPSRTGMTDGDAERLADCGVQEAEQDLSRYREDEGLRPVPVPDHHPVTLPRGCFTLGTIVWAAGGRRVRVEDLDRGDWIETTSGDRQIVRRSLCFAEIVEIDLEDEQLALSAVHQVLVLDVGRTPCHRVRVGYRLITATGDARTVRAVRRAPSGGPLVELGVGLQTQAYVGTRGVAVELPDTGPPVVMSVDPRRLSPLGDPLCEGAGRPAPG